MIGINAVDVTDHLETKAGLEHLLASGPATIYTFAAEGDFALTYISDNVKALVGWEPRHFLENPRFWIEHVHPEDRRQALKRLELPWPDDHQTFDYRFLAKDGAYRWMHDAVKLVRDPDGKPVEIAGAWMDITARKETEAVRSKRSASGSFPCWTCCRPRSVSWRRTSPYRSSTANSGRSSETPRAAPAMNSFMADQRRAMSATSGKSWRPYSRRTGSEPLPRAEPIRSTIIPLPILTAPPWS